MTKSRDYSSETIVQIVDLKETGHPVGEITEELAVSGTSQALVAAVQGGRE